ncbi:MAG: recombination protein RecR [Saprospiraceae bacterium]|nr:recombination protein RecR [Saprospiraceae bacterium]
MKYPSKILEQVVDSFSGLPGIGKKSALRIVLYLAQNPHQKSKKIVDSISRMTEELKICKECFSYSDFDICEICSNPSRDRSIICVVESIRDLMAIEDTQQFRGRYHILNGLISPLDGIGPDRLNIDVLVERIKSSEIQELIMAIRPSIEGDTTVYYINRQVESLPVKISLIARGISFGSELEYADEFTLGRSISERIPYQRHRA